MSCDHFLTWLLTCTESFDMTSQNFPLGIDKALKNNSSFNFQSMNHSPALSEVLDCAFASSNRDSSALLHFVCGNLQSSVLIWKWSSSRPLIRKWGWCVCVCVCWQETVKGYIPALAVTQEQRWYREVCVVVGLGNYTAKSIWPSLPFLRASSFFCSRCDPFTPPPLLEKKARSCHFYWRSFIGRLNGLKWQLCLSFSFSSPLRLTHDAFNYSKSKKICSLLLSAPPTTFTFPPLTHAITQTPRGGKCTLTYEHSCTAAYSSLHREFELISTGC